jgi:hypothetical protein
MHLDEFHSVTYYFHVLSDFSFGIRLPTCCKKCITNWVFFCFYAKEPPDHQTMFGRTKKSTEKQNKPSIFLELSIEILCHNFFMYFVVNFVLPSKGAAPCHHSFHVTMPSQQLHVSTLPRHRAGSSQGFDPLFFAQPAPLVVPLVT